MDGPTCQIPTTGLDNQSESAREVLSPADVSGVLDLFRQAASDEFFQHLKKELKLTSRRRIFDLPLVMWLMMVQRWDVKGTLSTAVQQVVEKRPAGLLGDHKRIRENKVSVHTGAYSDARQRMPVAAAEKVADRVFQHLVQTRRAALPDWDRRVFIFRRLLAGTAPHRGVGEGLPAGEQSVRGIALAGHAGAGGPGVDHGRSRTALLGTDVWSPSGE